MCRSLILGHSGLEVFPEAVLEALMPETVLALGIAYGRQYEGLSDESVEKYGANAIPNYKSGFSPDVLHAAIRFLTDRHCSRGFPNSSRHFQSIFDQIRPFETQISAIKEKAGPSHNYAPVLLGAMLGANHGRSVIAREWKPGCEEALTHHDAALVHDLLRVADGVADLWTISNAANEPEGNVCPPYLEQFLVPFGQI